MLMGTCDIGACLSYSNREGKEGVEKGIKLRSAYKKRVYSGRDDK